MDLFPRLRVYSVEQIKQKYNKLSDWIEMNTNGN